MSGLAVDCPLRMQTIRSVNRYNVDFLGGVRTALQTYGRSYSRIISRYNGYNFSSGYYKSKTTCKINENIGGKVDLSVDLLFFPI